MHIQEVFKAIYDNHLYEYFIINRKFEIKTYSDQVDIYCDNGSFDGSHTDIFLAIPELVGIENGLIEIFDGTHDKILLPSVFKAPNSYVNISICGGKTYSDDRDTYETVVILFENVTIITEANLRALQEHNEKSILSMELAKKNEQLEIFNQDMKRLIKIQERHAQMGELIGMITHQWKQPLSTINMNCGVLQIKHINGTLSKEVFDKQLENILKQSEYLNQTIIDFQNFFNPSKKRVYFNIINTIKRLLSLVKNDYSLKNISVEIRGDESLEIYGYSNEYNQVMLSILQNARDAFVQKPHKNMEIDILVSKKDEKSQVIIKDNAGGIPNDIIKDIFNIYTTTKKNGSGLGLHIAKSIIEVNLKGKLSVANIDSGVEFSILV
ncbi:MAG: HAMP domain-containing sensor histidine kinase [Sulfurovum sp.]